MSAIPSRNDPVSPASADDTVCSKDESSGISLFVVGLLLTVLVLQAEIYAIIWLWQRTGELIS